MPKRSENKSQDTSNDEVGKKGDLKRSETPSFEQSASGSEALTKRRYFYSVAGALFLLVFVATILPTLTGSSDFLFRESSLSIIYAVMSAAIALLTFGVIGDSTAEINMRPEAKLAIRVGGSAAGFLIFYWLLSAGINPYGYLDVFLMRTDNRLVSQEDGNFTVGLLGRIRQFQTNDSGQFLFPIPRSQELFSISLSGDDGRVWSIVKFHPEDCTTSDRRLLASCSEIWLTVSPSPSCLSNLSIASYDREPIRTTLETFLDSLKETIQELPDKVSANVSYSEMLVRSGLLDDEFELERKAQSGRPLCDHLASIENRFNLMAGERLVKSYLSCDYIMFALAKEPNPDPDRFKECLP